MSWLKIDIYVKVKKQKYLRKLKLLTNLICFHKSYPVNCSTGLMDKKNILLVQKPTHGAIVHVRAEVTHYDRCSVHAY